MSNKKEMDEVLYKRSISDVEFSNDFNMILDFNANLHPNAKEEIDKVKEFYDNTL